MFTDDLTPAEIGDKKTVQPILEFQAVQLETAIRTRKRVGSSIRDGTYELGLVSYYLNKWGVRNAQFKVLASGLTEQEAIKFWNAYDPRDDHRNV
jgi:hypothetical protein